MPCSSTRPGRPPTGRQTRGATLLALSAASMAGHAADGAGTPEAPPRLLAQASSGDPAPGAKVAAAPPVALPFGDDMRKYQNLSPKGFNLLLPTAIETVDPEGGGLRSVLADKGVGWLVMNLTNVAQNVSDSSRSGPGGVQQYNGQKFTEYDTLYAGVTYDLSSKGIPDGQVYVAGLLNRGTWEAIAPHKSGLSSGTYYQTLFDRRVEVKLGYQANTWEFINPAVGGALASSVFGPNGSIPIQGGLSTQVTPAPGANVKFNIDGRWYFKGGIQRAANPDGVVAEVASNRYGFRIDSPHAGRLSIGELGYQRNASADDTQLWVRGGGAYNDSATHSYEHPGTRVDHNYFFYLLGDQQVWQKPGTTPGRGVHVGASAMLAPSYANVVSQYYEFRLYGRGLIDSRPFDLASVVVTDTRFGSDAVALTRLTTDLVHSDSKAITFSYNARLARGVYSSLGLGYVNHPTILAYQRDTKSALNILGNLSLFF